MPPNEMYEPRRTASQRAIGFTIWFVIVMFVLMIASCGVSRVTTEHGNVSVVVDKPWTGLGHQGLRKEILTPGTDWLWASAEQIQIEVVPQKFPERFEDLTTSNNNFLDYQSYLVLKVTNAHTLYQMQPRYWYSRVVQEQFRTIVRNVVRTKTFDDIMTNPTVSADIETEVRSKLSAYLKEAALPIQLVDLSLGKATPNKPVIDEMNRTAAESQRYKTLVQTVEAEKQRALSEQKRAEADNAYRNAMSLNESEFIQLQAIKAYSEACKYRTANCVIMAGGSTPILNPQR